jgi:hypothetical protein
MTLLTLTIPFLPNFQVAGKSLWEAAEEDMECSSEYSKALKAFGKHHFMQSSSFRIGLIPRLHDSKKSYLETRPFNYMFFTPLYSVWNTGCPQISTKKIPPKFIKRKK